MGKHKNSRFNESAIIGIRGDTAKTYLQRGTKRLAIINKLLNLGGRATVKELETHFGFNITRVLEGLYLDNWICICSPEREMPRRTPDMFARDLLSE